MTQPSETSYPPINVDLGVAVGLDGQHLVHVQLRIGTTAFGFDAIWQQIEQLAAAIGPALTEAAGAARRANLGLVIAGPNANGAQPTNGASPT